MKRREGGSDTTSGLRWTGHPVHCVPLPGVKYSFSSLVFRNSCGRFLRRYKRCRSFNGAVLISRSLGCNRIQGSISRARELRGPNHNRYERNVRGGGEGHFPKRSRWVCSRESSSGVRVVCVCVLAARTPLCVRVCESVCVLVSVLCLAA